MPVFRPIRATARDLIAVGSAVFLVATILVGVFFSAGAQAAPGDLDLIFSGDGKQSTDFGLGDSGAAAIALQADGKIVVVGFAGNGGSDSNGFALARYDPDGSLDPSFSADGRQRTVFAGDGAEANAVAIQADGKIVVAGRAGGDFALARYNPNGSLDPSFSGDGKQTTDFVIDEVANAVAIQPDGKIVAAGWANVGGGSDFALARYNPNGSLDPSFSGDGRQTTDFAGYIDFAEGVVLQTDGKIIAVGGTEGDFGEDFALARYDSDGSLDPSFSGDGKQTTDFGHDDWASGVAIQADGKIVAAGHAGDFALARYNLDGSLDTSFSGDGRQTTDFGRDETAYGVAIQADGKIVAAGGGVATADPGFALARYDPDGSLDPSFSEDGKQTTDSGLGRSTGMALQADGKIVAVGPTSDSVEAPHHYALARYDPDGSLDTSFSGDGKQITEFGAFDAASGVALQADGKIVAVGGAEGDFALARYNPNGSLDTSFSGDGKQTTNFGSGDRASAVAIQPDGKIVAAGRAGGYGANGFALARYNLDGSLDPSFSGDGRQTTDFGRDDRANAVAIQPDGKIVAVGGARFNFALARYNPNGTLDASFSGGGQQVTDFGGGDRATGVAVQADGRIVAVGGDGGDISVGGGDFALARYDPDGSLDPTFSGDGRQTTDFGGSEGATAVALQANGRIVAVGGGDFALARYNPNGSLDTSFSGDGKQTTNFGGFDFAGAVALQADGGIVAAGGGGPDNFALARYNLDGSLDTSFSGDGKQTTDFGGFDAAHGVALQADGNIVAVGRGFGTDLTNLTTDFALARYLGG